ncbi:ribosome maturation factor RimM [Mycoplasmatota bacterium WC44]
MEYIKFGTLVNTHGLRGEVKIKSNSDFKDERFKKGNKIFIGKDVEVTIKSYRVHKGLDLVTFEEFNNINDVEKYKGKDVLILKDTLRDLDDDEFYFHELEGLDVYEGSTLLGICKEIKEMPSNQLLVLKMQSKEVLIPFVSEFIEEIDLENKKIYINTIEGML